MKEIEKEFEKLPEKYRRNILTLQNIFLKYKGNAQKLETLYRGMVLPENIYSKIIRAKVGQIIDLTGGFVSTSYSKYVARRFAYGDTGVVFVITRRIHPGIQLIEYSAYPYEEEVLLPYGFWNRLKILKKEKKDGIWYVYVEEI